MSLAGYIIGEEPNFTMAPANHFCPGAGFSALSIFPAVSRPGSIQCVANEMAPSKSSVPTTRTPWSGYQEAVDMISDGFDELLEGLVLKNSTREEIIEAIGDFYQPEPEIPPVTSDPKLSGVVSTIIFTVTSAKKDDNLLPGIQAFSETIFQPWKRRRIEGSKHGIYQAEILPRLIKEVKLSTTSELPWVLRALIEVDKCQEATELLFGCPLATLDNELAVRIYKALASGNHKHLFMQIPDLHSWHYQPPNYDLSIRVYPHEWLAICILGDERTELEELIKSES
jgi:hypothetical protein